MRDLVAAQCLWSTQRGLFLWLQVPVGSSRVQRAGWVMGKFAPDITFGPQESQLW
jgi:hypothetical protein